MFWRGLSLVLLLLPPPEVNQERYPCRVPCTSIPCRYLPAQRHTKRPREVTEVHRGTHRPSSQGNPIARTFFLVGQVFRRRRPRPNCPWATGAPALLEYYFDPELQTGQALTRTASFHSMALAPPWNKTFGERATNRYSSTNQAMSRHDTASPANATRHVSPRVSVYWILALCHPSHLFSSRNCLKISREEGHGHRTS